MYVVLIDEEVSGSGDGGRGVARRPGGGPIFGKWNTLSLVVLLP